VQKRIKNQNKPEVNRKRKKNSIEGGGNSLQGWRGVYFAEAEIFRNF